MGKRLDKDYWSSCGKYQSFIQFLDGIIPESVYTIDYDDIETNKYIDAYLAFCRIYRHVYNDGYSSMDAEDWEIPLLQRYVNPVINENIIHRKLYSNFAYLENIMNKLILLVRLNIGEIPVSLVALQYNGTTVAVRIKLPRKSYDIGLDRAKEIKLPLSLIKTKLKLYLEEGGGELVTDCEQNKRWYDISTIDDITDDIDLCNYLAKKKWVLDEGSDN